jgi:hypothetical protein
LTRRKPIISHQFDRFGFHHGLLRVHGQIQQSIDPIQLVVPNSTNGLFSHSALVGISGRLIMMRVWDEPRHSTENGEGFDFKVCSGLHDVGLIQGDVRVILFVYVEIFNQSSAEKVIKRSRTLFEVLWFEE